MYIYIYIYIRQYLIQLIRSWEQFQSGQIKYSKIEY